MKQKRFEAIFNFIIKMSAKKKTKKKQLNFD